MTKVSWPKLSKEIDNKEKWNKELYKKKITDADSMLWRVIYKDGSIKDFEKAEYPSINRKNVKGIGVVQEGQELHRIPVKDDVFAFRMRNLARGMVGEAGEFGFASPKRCVILYSPGEIAFVWDDGDVDELTEWGDKEPYTPFNLAEFEK